MIPKFRVWNKKTESFIDYGDLMLDLKNAKVYAGDVGIPEYTMDVTKQVILMQYTGLKDKNGVEIYEGDILYFEPYGTHTNDRVVEYIDGAYHGRLIRNGYSKLLAECVYETKVIGNVYENQGLLEVSE